MDVSATQEWPNQRLKVLVPVWTLLLISTAFSIWRVVYGLAQGRKFMISDYLLIVATCLNITATALTQVVVDAGLGRHILDPTVFPNLLRYSYYLWITQIVNIIAVAFLKWAICAWLLILNFSKIYRGVIWLSILMVTAFNFLAPVLTLFGCSPLERNWNYGYQGESRCWAKGSLPLSYTQGITNIITDLVYMAAPLIYLWRIQISRRTQWGIRIVFLLSIPATICSVFKTIELKTITNTTDPTWDGVQLTIWSSAELSIGILIASLPPLRKAMDHWFQKILPSTLTSSGKTPHYGYACSTGAGGVAAAAAGGSSIHMKNFQGSKAYHSRIPGESVLDSDDESERAILEGLKSEQHPTPGIIKSTDVRVTISADTLRHDHGHGHDDDEHEHDPKELRFQAGSEKTCGQDPASFKESGSDWASPHIESGSHTGTMHHYHRHAS